MDDTLRPLKTCSSLSLDRMLQQIDSDISLLKAQVESKIPSAEISGPGIGSAVADGSRLVRHAYITCGSVSSVDKLERSFADADVTETTPGNPQESCPTTDWTDEKGLVLQKLLELLQPCRLQWQDLEICTVAAGDFSLPKEIGRGSCCMVYRAKLKTSRPGADEEEIIEVAAKSFDGCLTSVEICESFLTEASILHSARHPCIVRFFGAYWPRVGTADADCDGGWLKPLIVVELMSGDLAEFQSCVSKRQVIQVLRDVGEALAHLHRAGVVHMDVKPENILINVDNRGVFVGRAKVTDFGVSRRTRQSCFDLKCLRVTVGGGTIDFLAPEIFGKEGRKADTSSDVWSFGALMCWLLSGCYGDDGDKWRRMSDIDVVSAVRDGSLGEKWLQRLVGCRVDENLFQLAAECLSLVPGDRPCMQDICIALEYLEAGLSKVWMNRIRGKSADELFDFGMALYFGLNCYRDTGEAGQWLQVAARLGSVEAEYVLGMAFVREDGVLRCVKDIDVICDLHRDIKAKRLGGNGTEHYFLALFYRHGITVNKDEGEYTRLLQEGADAGNASAQAVLDGCHKDGHFVENDVERVAHASQEVVEGSKSGVQSVENVYQGQGEAYCGDCERHVGVGAENTEVSIRQFQNDGRVMENRSPNAIIQLIDTLANSWTGGVKLLSEQSHFKGAHFAQDMHCIVESYRAAADNGNSDAANSLGWCYQNAIGVKKNVKLAFKHFERGAEAGNANALNNLGGCYQDGIGVLKNPSLAIELFQKAAEAGHSYAQVNLGNCYLNGIGVARNCKEAIRQYRKAERAGNIGARWSLGSCYEKGVGVEVNLMRAMELYRSAADGGNVDGMWSLGRCYQNGIGVRKNAATAVRYYGMAAEGGHVDAHVCLGSCYRSGIGVAKDARRALKMYHKAANTRHPLALWNVGSCYENGVGVVQTPALAFEFYRMSAFAGYARAQWKTGWCYETGSGVEKDLGRALFFYNMSLRNGYFRRARRSIERLGRIAPSATL